MKSSYMFSAEGTTVFGSQKTPLGTVTIDSPPNNALLSVASLPVPRCQPFNSALIVQLTNPLQANGACPRDLLSCSDWCACEQVCSAWIHRDHTA